MSTTTEALRHNGFYSLAEENVVLLQLGASVVDVQRRGDALGDDPGAEPSWGAEASAPEDASVEDEADLVGTTDVEVLADDVFEEHPPDTGRSSTWVRENSACRTETS